MNDKKIKYLYNKYSKIDKDGWEELKIVKKYIKGDIGAFFSYEENCGLFEDMNGKDLIKWYEKMKFSDIVDSKIVGMYECCTYSDPCNNKNYTSYKKKIETEFIKNMRLKELEFDLMV